MVSLQRKGSYLFHWDIVGVQGFGEDTKRYFKMNQHSEENGGRSHGHKHDHGHQHKHEEENEETSYSADECEFGDSCCTEKENRVVEKFPESCSLACVSNLEGEGGDECYDTPAVGQSEIKIKGHCCKIQATNAEGDLEKHLGVKKLRWGRGFRNLFVDHDVNRVSSEHITEILKYTGIRSRVIRDGSDGFGKSTSDLVKSIFHVDGMCCASETKILYTLLPESIGVLSVDPNILLRTVTVRHVISQIEAPRINDLIKSVGLDSVILRDGGTMVFRRNTAQSTGSPLVDPSDELRVPILQEEKDNINPKNIEAPRPELYVVLAIVLWLVSLCQYFKQPEFLKHFKYAALGSVALCLPKISWKAFMRLKKFSLDINILMSLACLGAVGMGDFSEAAAVVSLFSLSDWLERRATHSVRVEMNSLIEMNPDQAFLGEGNDVLGLGPPGQILAVGDVPLGARLSVRQGDKFPLDGKIVDGDTFADQSSITGESIPVKKSPGDAVYAGTINRGSVVEIIVTAIHEDSSMSRMLRLVQEASSARSKSQQTIEKVAGIYTPLIFATSLALATIPWAWGSEIGKSYAKSALALMVMACPCALVISTPITYICGLAFAAKRGILIKGGSHLEGLAHMTALCMDKTGTVTLGKFSLHSFEFVNEHSGKFSEREVMEMLYLTEMGSPHPLATALATGAAQYLPESIADNPNFDLSKVEILPGEGVVASLEMLSSHCTCEIKGTFQLLQIPPTEIESFFVGNGRLAARLGWNTVFPELAKKVKNWEEAGYTAGWIGVKGTPLAIYKVGDEVRPEARVAISELHNLNVRTVMLTGDNQGAAKSIASRVGIQEVHAGLLPSDKVNHIENLKRSEKVVGMVGDGVNDAPSLATADVSISLGCIGSAVAVETADVALMTDNLLLLAEAIGIGRVCYRKIFQNITFSIVTKIAILIVTFTIYSSLWLAVLVDVGGMLVVTVNSLTVLRSATYNSKLSEMKFSSIENQIVAA